MPLIWHWKKWPDRHAEISHLAGAGLASPPIFFGQFRPIRHRPKLVFRKNTPPGAMRARKSCQWQFFSEERRARGPAAEGVRNPPAFFGGDKARPARFW